MSFCSSQVEVRTISWSNERRRNERYQQKDQYGSKAKHCGQRMAVNVSRPYDDGKNVRIPEKESE